MTVTQTGGVPPPNNQFYGPANFGQPGFGSQYGPGFPYAPFGTNMPAFSPFPQQPGFGFNSPFQPLQPFQPIQPFQPFQPIQPFAPFPQSIATPQEFSAYLNGIQQQYNTYVPFSLFDIYQRFRFCFSFSLALFFFLILPLFLLFFSNEMTKQTMKNKTNFIENYSAEEALHSPRPGQQPLLALILGQLSTNSYLLYCWASILVHFLFVRSKISHSFI